MSIFRPSVAQTENRSLDDLSATLAAERNRRAGSSSSGLVADTDHAMRLGAVWSCLDLISRLSALPVSQFRRAGKAPEEVGRPSQLLSAPWPQMHAIGWRRQILMSWLTSGNVFGLVGERDQGGWPTKVQILSPARMKARPLGEGMVEWFIDGRPAGDDLIHWPAFTMPGSPIGLSPLEYAAATVGLGLQATEFGRRWFVDGAHPSSVLVSDSAISQEQALIIKERFRNAIAGREPAVLGHGLSYEAIQISPEESQFLATVKANKADIAGFFLVPPEMIGGESGNSQTYANVEQRSLNYLTYNAGWWVTLLEELLSSMVPSGEYCKINTGALVKVDVRTQAEVESLRIRGGWGTPNEAREHEDRPPLPGGEGDRTLWPPMSTTPVSTNGEALQ